jgi:hypothetical protein
VLPLIRLDLTLVHPVADPQAVAAIQEHTNACDGDGPATSQRLQPGGIHAFPPQVRAPSDASGSCEGGEHPVPSGNLRLVEVARDEGQSGSNGFGARAGLAEALALLERGEAEVLVVYRLDAWLVTSSPGDPHGPAAPALGGGALASEPDVDSDDPTRVLVRQVLGAISQYAVITTVAQLIKALRRDQFDNASQRRLVSRRPLTWLLQTKTGSRTGCPTSAMRLFGATS